MKGRCNFSTNEINMIKKLLKQKTSAPSNKQKPYRDKLRDIGFYITDFDTSFNGFTDTDLDEVIKRRIITIDDEDIDSKSENNLVESSNNNLVSDEEYVLGLCDEVLGLISSRQHRFDFLRGDPGKDSKGTMLPVDAYYKEIGVVVEYKEKQHFEEVPFFDKTDRITVSGVHRGEQRKIYDERRREVLPPNGISLIEISYEDFDYDSSKKIIRNREKDKQILKGKLENNGVF